MTPPTPEETWVDTGKKSTTTNSGILAPGSTFHGDFQISDWVRAGGMGEVYKAENTINKSLVAIKLIRSDLSHDPDIIERFMQEDKALRSLNDPAVVRYFGVRRDPVSERLYIQMEFVDGPTLGDYLGKNGAISAEAARGLTSRLAQGLMDAHSHGVIHRDLSPDNILLPDGVLAEAKIIDFGISKVATNNEFTVFRESFVGKIRYASPEHFSSTAPIDQKSDIYSLGLIIAAATAGRPLPMGQDELSGASARLQVPDLTSVPAEIRPIVARMLAPQAAGRPTAAELVALVSTKARKSPPKSGGGIWIGLVVVLVLAAGGGAAWFFLAKPPAPEVVGPSSPPTVIAPTSTPAATPTPAVTFSALQQSVAGLSDACSPIQLSQPQPTQVSLIGLVGNSEDAARLTSTVTQAGYTLDNHLAVSSAACQILQTLGQFTKVNPTTGANRPIIAIGRTPPVFKVGEELRLNIVVPLTGNNYVYRIAIDGAGVATVDHQYSRSFIDLSTDDTVKAAGWNLVAVIVSPVELTALEALQNPTPDQVNTALTSDLMGAQNPTHILSTYQMLWRE